jgi:spermidine synthase
MSRSRKSPSQRPDKTSERPPSQPSGSGNGLTYAGIFVLALASLMLEVLLTRITSVMAWYHLAFFVISLAMLGMTAGAVLVFLRPAWFSDADVARRMAESSLGFALAIPVCLALVLAHPLVQGGSLMDFLGLMGSGLALALPFVLSGVALTLALTRAGLPAGRAYGIDLLGAASGCALVIPVLARLDAPSAALLAAALAALAAALFAAAEGGKLRAPIGVGLGLLVLALVNASQPFPSFRPAWVKGRHEDVEHYDAMRWNSHSRVTIEKTVTAQPFFWAAGTKAPATLAAPIKQRQLVIDGVAGTVMVDIGAGVQAHDYLAYEMPALLHQLRPRGPAAVIGVGGGRDVLAAARTGHESVVGIELNGLIVDAHQNLLRSFSGLADLPGVSIVQDEARSYLAHDRQQYSAIAMSLIDTWASTGTGAYSLSENGLYTVEAWQTFMRRLTEDGIFSVSRFYYAANPGETARMLSLALAALWQSGAQDPRAHIIVLQNNQIATLLLCRSPYSAADLDELERVADARGFNLLTTPRKLPDQPLLRALLSQPSLDALNQFADTQLLDLSPPSDARPFFFNMLRPGSWLLAREEIDKLDNRFLGNLVASQSLLYSMLVSLLLTALALLLPMRAKWSELSALHKADVFAALGYFALIGLGFMFVEIGLLSRLSVFLGHPTLALAVLLGGMISFTGVGSLLSARLPLDHPRWARWYPLLPALLVALASLLALPAMRPFQDAAVPVRIVVSLGILLLPSLAMGLCFPLGLRLCERMETARTGAAPRLGPWLWGINGAFGVCASGLALACSMVWGVPVTLGVGAACYLLLLAATRRLVA